MNHGHESGDGSTPITKLDWNSGFLNIMRTKWSCSPLAAHTFPRLEWEQNAAIEYKLWGHALQQTLWPHSTSSLQQFRGRYSCLWHIRQNQVLQQLMFAMLSELWLDIGKNYRDIQVHYQLIRSWPVNPFALHLSHILTGLGHTLTLWLHWTCTRRYKWNRATAWCATFCNCEAWCFNNGFDN